MSTPKLFISYCWSTPDHEQWDAQLVARTVGYHGQILTDPSKPDGTPRKLMDVSRLAALGWKARIPLDEGIAATYRWYRDTVVS